MEPAPLGEANPYAAPTARIGEEPSPETRLPRGFRRTVARGAWLGWKWTTILCGPLALVLFVMVVGTYVWTSDPRNGYRVPARAELGLILLGLLASYLVCVFYGVVTGALVSAVAYPFLRDRDRVPPA